MLNPVLAAQSLKSLLTRRLSLSGSDKQLETSPPVASRSFTVEKIANGYLVSPGMPGIVRYCKDADEAATLVGDRIRELFR